MLRCNNAIAIGPAQAAGKSINNNLTKMPMNKQNQTETPGNSRHSLI